MCDPFLFDTRGGVFSPFPPDCLLVVLFLFLPHTLPISNIHASICWENNAVCFPHHPPRDTDIRPDPVIVFCQMPKYRLQ